MTAEAATMWREPVDEASTHTGSTAPRRRRWSRRAEGASAQSDAGEVYRVLGPAVFGYLQGRRVDDPENLLGEVFLHVTRSLPQFEGDDDELRRWVFAIARNRVIDHRRRAARRPEEVVEVAEGPDARFDEHLLYDAELIAAIGSLTDEQREVIALRFIADLPLETVADMTGRTVGAVKAMQHRALGRLSQSLRAQGARLA
jgi:RNA polymerase sigma-70 factor (ECF subfamily)